VLSALRLGWYMAEVRGRNRPGGAVPPAENRPSRQGHVLPLRIERRNCGSRLRQDAYTDLVAAAIAEAPDKPGARRPDSVVTGEIRKRTLTTVAGAAVP
jgi:hypothetical protein